MLLSRRPALFLDRDGVINIDHAYVCKPENFEFVDGIFELCRTAKRLGYLGDLKVVIFDGEGKQLAANEVPVFAAVPLIEKPYTVDRVTPAIEAALAD